MLKTTAELTRLYYDCKI